MDSIIEDDQNLAVSFVQELSSLYRYVLQTRLSTLVTVREELVFIGSYKFLMSHRFGDNLSIVITVPDKVYACLLMPFSLQLLVENAVKHNIISGKRPLTVTILENEGYLVVVNNLQKKKTSRGSTRIGLENIATRYRLMTEKEVRITETASAFKVEIPLIDPS